MGAVWTAFQERFFPREITEAKVEEFINLKQGSMTVREYSLKFVKLSRYETSLVPNNRDEMSRFLTRISEDLEEDFREEMLHDSMDLFRLMIDSNRGGGRNTFGVRDHPRFKKGHQSSGNFNSQRGATPRGRRTEPKKGNVGDVQHPRQNVASVAVFTVERAD
ncbi:uncharacterized protein [Solanum lycopersicum]|uniref:uncharacterized protein n=1 Tax=Solanum lycopersicum TaxID=4081 RepID=UPI0002BC9E1D|nr:uncharacterized protein LOC101264682 [Solanum lycopersicum]